MKGGLGVKLSRLFISFCLLLAAFAIVIPTFSAESKLIYKVPIHEEVENGLHAFLKRSIKEAEEAGADAIIFDIDTPGGFVHSAENIVNLLDSTDIRKIAYINSEALSAGAYLALHTDEIYMSPNGSIGAAAVIDSAGNAADMKATSAWKAKMINAAERTGKNPIYAQAMADESIDLPQYRAGKGQLLTLSANEAIKVGYSEGTVATFSELLVASNLEGSKVVETEQAFVETLARIVTNPVVVPILLSLASLGLVLELYSPGFGIPGTVGLLSLGLFFYGHLVAGMAGYESIILLVIGIILIIAEFFVPGGIIGIIGLAAVLFSIILAGGNLFYMSVAVLIAITVAILGMVIIVKFFGKRVRLLNKMILTDATTTEQGYVSNQNRLDLVGRIAETMTPLRPSGTIRIENERIDAVSDGSFIGKEKKVVIIKVEGSRIVVREAREGEATQ